MEIINIESVNTIKNRPFSLKLSGYFRSDRFRAEMQGVCLEILTAVPFNENEKKKIEEKLQDIFSPAMGINGKYDKRIVKGIMNDNGNLIQIRV